jgi:hypothetical protein
MALDRDGDLIDPAGVSVDPTASGVVRLEAKKLVALCKLPNELLAFGMPLKDILYGKGKCLGSYRGGNLV